MKISIYLAGNIQKSHEGSSKIFWSEEDIKEFARHCAPIEITFMNPADRTDDLSDQLSVFGRDITQVSLSDAILVDARGRRGLGVGAEMMWAKVRSIPVVTLAPHGTHYRKEEVTLLGETVENWNHPFVESLSDRMVDNLEEAAVAVKELLASPDLVKGPESIEKAMDHYQSTQLEKDAPMRTLVESEEFLMERLSALTSYA